MLGSDAHCNLPCNHIVYPKRDHWSVGPLFYGLGFGVTMHIHNNDRDIIPMAKSSFVQNM